MTIREIAGWIRSRLYRQAVLAAFCASLGLVLVISLLSFYFTRGIVLESIRANLISEAELFFQKIDQDIKLAVYSGRSLAAHTLIKNALLDSSGRQGYLSPFISQYRASPTLDVVIKLLDFQGRVIASNTAEHKAAYPWSLEAIEKGQPLAKVYHDLNNPLLVLAFPVVFPGTGQIEGLLVCELPVSKLFHKEMEQKKKNTVESIIAGDGRTIFSSGQEGDDNLVITYPLALEPPFDKLGLVIRVSRAKEEALAPLNTLKIYYFIFGIVTVIAAIFLSHLTSRKLTAPLERLSDTVKTVYESGNVKIDVPKLGNDEVGNLAAVFSDLLDSIASYQENMEARIESRTTELSEKESYLRRIIDNAIDGIVIIDGKGRIETFNPAAQKIFGYDSSILGQNVRILMPEPHRSGHDGYLQAAEDRREGGILGKTRTLEGIRSNNELFPLELSISDMYLKGRRMFIGVLRDITERRNSEVALERAKLAAEEANSSKSAFLAMMSHEVRTPMTAIIGISELLLSSGLEGERRSQMQSLRRSAENLMGIINDILDFSKIEAGKMAFESIDFDLRREISDIMEFLRFKAEEKGLALELDMPEPYPHVVQGDPSRFRQILVNLLGNAIKFTNEGFVLLKYTAYEESENEYRLTFQVQDSGIGIDEERQRKLFRPFEQAGESVTRRFGGTGLGLAITRRLVEAMRGSIAVRSRPGEGSTFSFSIILGRGNPELITAGENVGATDFDLPAEPVKTDRLRILLAEDNETNRMLIQSIMERFGHGVTGVENGALAVEALQKDSYDAVIMDMQMPVMDGATAMRTIRTFPGWVSTVPIVALTADAITEHAGEYVDSGADEVLTKPVNWKRLNDTLLGLCAKNPRPGASPPAERTRPETVDEPSSPVNRFRDIPDFDPGVIAELKTILGAQLVTILASVGSNTEAQLNLLKKGMEDNDREKSLRAAHTLKGLAGQFGAKKASAMAEFIRKNAPDMTMVALLAGEMEKSLKIAGDEIALILKNESSRQPGT